MHGSLADIFKGIKYTFYAIKYSNISIYEKVVYFLSISYLKFLHTEAMQQSYWLQAPFCISNKFTYYYHNFFNTNETIEVYAFMQLKLYIFHLHTTDISHISFPVSCQITVHYLAYY